MTFTYEIYLLESKITKEEWQGFIRKISSYTGYLHKWVLTITFSDNKVRYFLNTKYHLPPSINGLKSFMLKIVEEDKDSFPKISIPLLLELGLNSIDIKNHFAIRKNEEVKKIDIEITPLNEEKFLHKTTIKTLKNNFYKKYRLFLSTPTSLLTIDFKSNYNLSHKSVPKYLDISKSLPILGNSSTNSILKVDGFPYLQRASFLDQDNINFAKHSIVFGSSGCGKSKFLSLLVHNIYQNQNTKTKYKIVVIDPHASLENDIGGIGNVIDFKTSNDSINLFANNNEDTIISVELLIDIFSSLIPNNYNSKLERVLRHSLYLLLQLEKFNFSNLRNLLLDMGTRNELIKENVKKLPSSIIEFFLSEFNEIKTKSYTEAISPIIAFIDEMEMIPVFYENNISYTLKDTIDSNFLTIFSLDRTKLGDKVTKTISGLIMQQLLILVQNYSFKEHLIFIVDEVAVIENPILNRFLSEARKYNLSLILAGQYFSGISSLLQKSIFANVINYYIFRLSSFDAGILAENFNMKIPLNNTKEQKIKMITELQDRECLVRINSGGTLYPPIKCQTLDFTSIPRQRKKSDNIFVKEAPDDEKKLNFTINKDIKLTDILIQNGTSRKVVNK